MACAYDSCELAAAREFRTAFFDCSKSGSLSIVLVLVRLVVFSDVGGLPAASSMVNYLDLYGLERRFRLVSGLPTIPLGCVERERARARYLPVLTVSQLMIAT